MIQSMSEPVEEKREPLPIAVRVKWIDGLRFVASDEKGHSIVMDVSRGHGGQGSGFGPMQLLLVAFGGCTGVDLVELLGKQRQRLEDLEIKVSGERVRDPPRVYGRVHVEYVLKGENLKDRAVRRAIRLSQEKLCSVGATLRAKAKVSYDYSIQQG